MEYYNIRFLQIKKIKISNNKMNDRAEVELTNGAMPADDSMYMRYYEH